MNPEPHGLVKIELDAESTGPTCGQCLSCGSHWNPGRATLQLQDAGTRNLRTGSADSDPAALAEI